MIVAPRTTDGEAEKALADVVDDIFIQQVQVVIDVVTESASDRKIACCYNSLVALAGAAFRSNQVASKLQPDELIKRDVSIQAIQNPIAIPPCVRQGPVRVLASRISVSHDVQPVPPPTSAILWRVQEPVQNAFERVR